MTRKKMNPATERFAIKLCASLKSISPSDVDIDAKQFRLAIIAGVNITIDAAANSQPLYLLDAGQIKRYLARRIKDYTYNGD